MKRSLNPRWITLAWGLLLLIVAVTFPLIVSNLLLVNGAVLVLMLRGWRRRGTFSLAIPATTRSDTRSSLASARIRSR